MHPNISLNGRGVLHTSSGPLKSTWAALSPGVWVCVDWRYGTHKRIYTVHAAAGRKPKTSLPLPS